VKSCHYCGRENDQQAERCDECGTAFAIPARPPPFHLKNAFQICLGIYPEGFVRKWPVLGIVSVLSPFIGFFLAIGINHLLSDGSRADGVSVGLVRFFNIMLSVLLLGGVSAFFGLSRGEKCRAFALVGLALNFGPVLWTFLSLWVRRG
jgi:hypothetical protein